MNLELSINTDFLDQLDPPSSFPPNQQQLIIQIQNKFLTECQRFIQNQKILYKCSKSIESKLKSIITHSSNIQQNLSTHKDKFNNIHSQLLKYKEQKEKLKERQKMLKMICDLIKMEEIRKDLLVHPEKTHHELSNKIVVGNQDQYLANLEKLSKIIEESAALADLKEEFTLIKDITQELQSIFQQAIQQLLKELMTPKMVELALTKYSHIFFNQNLPNDLFYQSLIKNRVQHMKINLNPMINNLNYATNIPQLYESILVSWIELLHKEKALFSHCQQFAIIRTANLQLIREMIPKMEKNIFRIKELVQVVRIRKYFSDFAKELQGIEEFKAGSQEQPKDQNIDNLINKCEAIIEHLLTEQSESLENSKYNIYTLVSYIPIRQHLQKLKLCFQYSLQNQTIDWEVAFYNLFSSRDPKNYPNNKSLIIFNLNIWYLYLKLILKGKYKKEGQELMQWCKNTFTAINIQETNKKYYESFDKMLELGGNLIAFKNTLYAEIQLLGHEELRKELASLIKEKYLSGYDAILTKIDKKPMNNEQVKQFCASKKINLNKFGKFSQSVCIFSREQLSEQLDYN